MSDAPATVADAGPSDEVMQRAREALEHVSIANVHPASLTAELLDVPRAAEQVSVEVEASYSVGPGAYSNRFTYQLDLGDDKEEPVAAISFVLQVDYVVDDPDFELDHGAADFICATTGLFAAYPYARELAQSLTTRLQLDPLVLGLLPRGASRPSGVTRVTRPGDDVND